MDIEFDIGQVFRTLVGDGECKRNEQVNELIRQKPLDVPDPEDGVPAPLLLVADEDCLQTDVRNARKAPEQDPGHRLLEAEDISPIPPDAAHPPQWTIAAHELVHLWI